MDLAFCQFDALGVLARYVNLLRVPTTRMGGTVARQLGEGGEIYSRVSCGLDQLDVFARTTTHDRVQAAFKAHRITLPAELVKGLVWYKL